MTTCNEINGGINGILGAAGSLSSKLDQVIAQNNNILSRIGGIESRLDSIENRINSLEYKIDNIARLIDALESVINNGIETIKSTVNNLIDSVEEIIKTALTGLSNELVNFFNQIVKLIRDLLGLGNDDVNAKLEEIKNLIRDTRNELGRTIVDVGQINVRATRESEQRVIDELSTCCRELFTTLLSIQYCCDDVNSKVRTILNCLPCDDSTNKIINKIQESINKMDNVRDSINSEINQSETKIIDEINKIDCNNDDWLTRILSAIAALAALLKNCECDLQPVIDEIRKIRFDGTDILVAIENSKTFIANKVDTNISISSNNTAILNRVSEVVNEINIITQEINNTTITTVSIVQSTYSTIQNIDNTVNNINNVTNNINNNVNTSTNNIISNITTVNNNVTNIVNELNGGTGFIQEELEGMFTFSTCNGTPVQKMYKGYNFKGLLQVLTIVADRVEDVYQLTCINDGNNCSNDVRTYKQVYPYDYHLSIDWYDTDNVRSRYPDTIVAGINPNLNWMQEWESKLKNFTFTKGNIHAYIPLNNYSTPVASGNYRDIIESQRVLNFFLQFLSPATLSQVVFDSTGNCARFTGGANKRNISIRVVKIQRLLVVNTTTNEILHCFRNKVTSSNS